MGPIVLLGPQRLDPVVAEFVRAAGITGRIALLTAGWEEREAEDDELSAHLGGRTVNLGLYRRQEEILAAEAGLRAAIHAYDAELDTIRRHYRLRLGFALDAARALLNLGGDSPHLVLDRAGAIETVRRLDAELLTRVASLRAEVASRLRLPSHPLVARHKAEIRSLIDGCDAVAIAGGHVGVLSRVLRIFDLVDMLGTRPLFAWSAGAMVIGERIVLFHDHPPQGAGNSEVHDHGLGLFTGLLPLPHARRRLRLADPNRVRLFARRHEPRRLALMNEGSALVIDRGRIARHTKVRTVSLDGAVIDWPGPGSPGR
ncbi:MAG: Type 1 glutamine amidotransferase-like domain-containing protein [Phycisphaeraceae bacterium]|nr:Type 1 glutamine amidotransferase-like domain-containing protein [Phycisphaeraceae bacterium]